MAVQNLKIALALRHQTNLYVKLLDVPDILSIKTVVIQADHLSTGRPLIQFSQVLGLQHALFEDLVIRSHDFK